MSLSPDARSFIKRNSAPPPLGTPYAVALPGTEREGRTAIYRNWRFKDGPLLDTVDPAKTTFYELWQASAAARANYKCLGWRPWNTTTKTWEPKYVWMTYGEVDRRTRNFGAGLVELHQRIGTPDDKFGVGLWAQNRPEWQMTELAAISQSLWTVSLYETLGPEATEYIVNHGQLQCVVCSLPHVPTLLKIAPRIPSLKIIISMDSLDAGEPAGLSKLALLNQTAAEHGIQLYSMEGVEAIGAKAGRGVRPPRKDDTLTINYTSGTTGNPKGVVITHAASVSALSCALLSDHFYPGDVHISYLPLAHIYGRMADQVSLVAGSCIGYFHGDITALVDDIKILRPTGLFSVPRLFNKINSAVKIATVEADGFKGTLSRRVVEAKKASMSLPRGQANNKHFLYDRIWTNKVRKGVGFDRLHTLVSGSAQLDPAVQEFLRAAFGVNVVQGFGMTETYAVGLVQMDDDFTIGNIGPPQGGVEVCIESVPDFEYTVDDKPYPRGEMLLRGPIMFKEYYKNPEETKKVVESDGWFHTGDIVQVDEMGRLKIIDRKKNVLKLAQGEYISPERIENVYLGGSNLINLAYVHGEPQESTLVAVFGIDPAQFSAFAGKVLKQAISPEDRQALKAAMGDPRVKKAFLKRLDDIGRRAKFNSYERVRNCILEIDPFTIENELLTPTLKLKRPQTARKYHKDIERMYHEINAQATAKPKL